MPVQTLTMSQPVPLLHDYGPNVGHAVATRFAAQGYEVAIASRSLPEQTSNEAGWMQVQFDLAYPETIPGVFSKGVERLDIPNVIVYHGK